MREIKFRSWDKPNNKMVPSVMVFGHAMGTSVTLPHGEYAPGSHWKKDNFGNTYCDDGSVIPLQYTGLKDKDDVEIYEGDVIKVFITEECDCGKTTEVDKFISEVKWLHASRACFGWKNNYGWQSFDPSQELEVIGNIYENPELLKVNHG